MMTVKCFVLLRKMTNCAMGHRVNMTKLLSSNPNWWEEYGHNGVMDGGIVVVGKISTPRMAVSKIHSQYYML